MSISCALNGCRKKFSKRKETPKDSALIKKKTQNFSPSVSRESRKEKTIAQRKNKPVKKIKKVSKGMVFSKRLVSH